MNSWSIKFIFSLFITSSILQTSSCGKYKDIRTACTTRSSLKDCIYGPYCFGFANEHADIVADQCSTNNIGQIGSGRMNQLCSSFATVTRVGFRTYEIKLVGRLTKNNDTQNYHGWVGITFFKFHDITNGSKAIICSYDGSPNENKTKGQILVEDLIVPNESQLVIIENCTECNQSEIITSTFNPIDIDIETGTGRNFNHSSNGWLICQFNLTSSRSKGAFNYLTRHFYIGLAGNKQRSLNILQNGSINSATAAGEIFYDPLNNGKNGSYFGSSNKEQDFFKILRIRVGNHSIRSLGIKMFTRTHNDIYIGFYGFLLCLVNLKRLI